MKDRVFLDTNVLVYAKLETEQRQIQFFVLG
jgi:predicted nucleic acid-binding protein